MTGGKGVGNPKSEKMAKYENELKHMEKVNRRKTTTINEREKWIMVR